MPAFKDEHVLVIAPGSQTTLAQLGLPETFTPPRWRFPSRMFPGPTESEWDPVKVQSRTVTKTTTIPKQINGITEEKKDSKIQPVDVEMLDASATPNTTAEGPIANGDVKVEGTTNQDDPVTTTGEDKAIIVEEETLTTTEETFEDDPISLEDAVYPLREGRIENWPCFFALLSHIYKFISPPFHMPVLVITQPCWTTRDKEWITQYFFESWKIPALCLMDSAVAATYAYGVASATVVDVGYDKCDVSAVNEYVLNDIGRGVAISGCGGSAMTRRLEQLLKKRLGNDANSELAEQLKKSLICEILPPGITMPSEQLPQPVTGGENPAALASTGATGSGQNARDAEGQRPGQGPRGPGVGTEVGEEQEDENEGVLDVAAIVAQNNAAEVLAKREKEKAERAAAKKGGAAQDARPARLKNIERQKTTFTYEEFLPYDAVPEGQSRKRKREVEIGLERFMPHTPLDGESEGILETIAAAVHSTIMAVPEISARSALWDNLIILGNGSRVRGFSNALISLLSSRYTLSPSTATIFTSELPSNFSTPVGTNGTNTPIPGQSSQAMHHPGHGVNPLLVAATKNMMQPGGGIPQHLGIPGQPGMATPMSGMDPAFHQSFRGFTQTPTSMKTVKAPDYFPEWKDPSVSGMEDAVFLGAQVAAKLVFIVDAGVNKGFLTRTDYNEMGPEGIHLSAM